MKTLLIFLALYAAAGANPCHEIRHGDRLAIKRPRLEYPIEARRNKITGSGIVLVKVDSAGVVTSTEMAQSTGSPILDRAAMDGYRRWRFRPGQDFCYRTPVTFTLPGYSYNSPRVSHVAQQVPRRRPAMNEEDKPPYIGMTKGQVLARYGEPRKHTITDEGERWVYLLNFGEMMGKAFIPFNFKGTPPRTGVIIFGPDSRVKKFDWDIPTDD